MYRFIFEITNSIFAIIAGIFYDLLKKAPVLAVGPRGGLSIFARRGSTILEGLAYGGLSKEIITKLNCSDGSIIVGH
jgi:hypothetical protein